MSQWAFADESPASKTTDTDPQTDPKALFQIRPARISAGDDALMIKMYDSQIPWLRSIGAGFMWSSKAGGNPEKEKGWYDMIAACDDQSVDAGYSACFGKEWKRAFIAEMRISLDESHKVDYLRNALGSIEEFETSYNEILGVHTVTIPVAAIVLDSTTSDGTLNIIHSKDRDAPFVFLTLLLSYRRVEQMSKGAGAALLRYVREQVIPKIDGVERFAGDCYAGNDARLVKYYEKQGFEVIGQWTYKRKDGDWPTSVFEMWL